jgi:hypothetical protein
VGWGMGCVEGGRDIGMLYCVGNAGFQTASNSNPHSLLTTRATAPDELRAMPVGRSNVAVLPTPSEKGAVTPSRPASVRTAPVETSMARTT